MCSVGGWINFSLPPEELRELVLEMMTWMVWRGDDAAGIAVYKSPQEVWIKKEPISITEFKKKLEKVKGWEKARIGLLHARAWTQCPPINNYCNHPLVDVIHNKVISLVHNGVVNSMVKPYSDYLRYEVDSDILLAVVRYHKALNKNIVKEMLKIPGSKAVLVTDGT
jgi:glucosamine 6-phosphate synthetase-like amidotransferase/phosphosugar isomerase protein